MNDALVIGQITVKDPALWAQYRSQVPPTLAPWGGELVFRGQQVAALAGDNPHADVVVIRFPSTAAVQGWFGSAPYQALVPLRLRAAEVVLVSYAAAGVAAPAA